MRFQFPQFIDTKGKIVGPFTLFQFLYLAAAGVVFFFLRFVVGGTLLIILGVILGLFALALGFLKIDNVTLPRYILNAFAFIISPKRYIFSKQESEEELYGIPKIPETKDKNKKKK